MFTWAKIRKVPNHIPNRDSFNFVIPLTQWVWTSHVSSRDRRVLVKNVLLRTRRVLSLYNLYGNNALLVFNGTSLNSNKTLLALNWRYLCIYIKWRRKKCPTDPFSPMACYTIYLILWSKFMIPKLSTCFLFLERTHTQSFYNNDT